MKIKWYYFCPRYWFAYFTQKLITTEVKVIRYLFNDNQFSKSKNIVKRNAYLDKRKPEPKELSVYRNEFSTEEERIKVGRKVNKKKLLALAIIHSDDIVKKHGLKLYTFTYPHKLHSNIKPYNFDDFNNIQGRNIAHQMAKDSTLITL